MAKIDPNNQQAGTFSYKGGDGNWYDNPTEGDVGQYQPGTAPPDVTAAAGLSGASLTNYLSQATAPAPAPTLAPSAGGFAGVQNYSTPAPAPTTATAPGPATTAQPQPPAVAPAPSPYVTGAGTPTASAPAQAPAPAPTAAPNTGINWSSPQYQQSIRTVMADPNQTPANMRAAMQEWGVSNEQLMAAMGWTQQQFNSYFGITAPGTPAPGAPGGSGGQAPASGGPINTSNPANPPGVIVPEASQVTGYQGTSLSSATSTTPQQVVAQNANATNWNVNADQTVQGQIEKIIARNSPLSQMAETRAAQQANARGLANSSMAVQAGQAALYDAALPIAQQDANTYAQSGHFNAGQETDVSKFNASQGFDASKTNATLQTQNQQFNAEQQNKMRMFEVQNDSDIAKFNASESNALKKLGMDSSTKLELANIEAGYKMLMQTQAGASDLYKQSMLNIANIMANKDMNEEAKRVAIQNQTTILNNGLGLLGRISNLDLGDLLDFGGTPAPTPAPAAPAPTPAPAQQGGDGA
jgi:hypothetical protein